MKKTLVALAAFAATGAFAQVTVTGAVAYGYMQTSAGSAAGNVDASGFGVDTAELNFGVTEDLGKGTTVTGKIQFDTVARAGVTGGDVILGIATANAGAWTFASTKGADYLSGGIAAVGNKGLDNAVFSTRGSNDSVSFSYPLTSSIKLGFSHVEGAKAASATSLGLGNGNAGADNGEQRRNLLSLDYASGALVANVGVGAYDNIGNVATNLKNITRASASYDLGMVKLGAGFDSRTYVTGTRMDYAVGAMAPLTPAFSAGVLWGSRTHSDTLDATKDGTRTGYSLRLNYGMSKLTNITFDYQNYKKAFVDTNNSTMAELYFTKAF